MGSLCEFPRPQISSLSLMYSEYHHKSLSLSVLQGNIIEEDVDAIITFSTKKLKYYDNSSLNILNKAGSSLIDEIKEILNKNNDRIENAGEIIVTSGGNLPSTYIFHLVMEGDGNEGDDFIKKCVGNILEQSERLKIKTISLPLIYISPHLSSKKQSIRIMIESIVNFIDSKVETPSLREIRFVDHNNPTVRLIKREMMEIMPEKDMVRLKREKEAFAYEKNKFKVPVVKEDLEQKNLIN